MIREMIGKPDAHVHFMVGGTPTNTVTIAAALRPFEGVISADSGHIYVHETGSVEQDTESSQLLQKTASFALLTLKKSFFIMKTNTPLSLRWYT